MNNLPISVNNTTVNANAAKQSSSKDAVQAEASEFGNVLSRQVNNKDKTTPPPNRQQAGDNNKKITEQDTREPDQPTEETSAVSAEMLATLKLQQDQAMNSQEMTGSQAELAKQPDALMQTGLLQPLAITAVAANSTASTGQSAQDPLLPHGVHPALGGKPQPAWETAQPSSTASLSDANRDAAMDKTVGVNELNAASSARSSSTSGVAEAPLPLQQAFMPPLLREASATSGTAMINTPLTQPAWGEEFSQKITWLAGQRNQSAELHLNPPHLGPLEVVLKMDGDQASAMFTSPHAAVRDAIEQALPQLREMLADSGIMLGDASVYDQATSKNQDRQTRNSAPQKPEAEAESASNASVRSAQYSRHNGMVDTFA